MRIRLWRPFHLLPGRLQRLSQGGQRIALTGILLLGLILLLAACDFGASTSTGGTHKQTVQTDNGSPITYSTLAQDVVLRLFSGGGKVGSLEFTPEISIYGDGTYLLGPGLQLRQGSISNDSLQKVLQTLANQDKLLQLQQKVFNDIPGQNATLLQMNVNGQSYQFLYGPYGNLQESTQDLLEYQQLGNAIKTIKQALTGPLTTYTSTQKALLVYQTYLADYSAAQNQTIPIWPLSDIDLSDAAVYECGAIPVDETGPNADNGCLVYTVPKVAYLPTSDDLNQIKTALAGQQQGMFLQDTRHYIVILRPLLPDELAQNQLAMYGSNNQTYTPIPLQSGAIPVPTPTP